MIRRFLQIAVLGLLLTGTPLVVRAAEDPALVQQVQTMLMQRGYLRGHESEWGNCSQRAAAAFLSDNGWTGTVPELDRLAEELRKAAPTVRHDGDPVC